MVSPMSESTDKGDTTGDLFAGLTSPAEASPAGEPRDEVVVPDDGTLPDEAAPREAPSGPISFASIASLYRYPVKGLTPERLEVVELTEGGYFPGDRLFAIENGPSGFLPEAPAFQPKIKFLMLMRNERLAALRTRYDDVTGELILEQDGAEAARGNLHTPEGREAIEAFFQRYSRYELRGAPKVLQAPAGFRFVDTTRGYVSLINLASCRALGEMIGRPVDPLRFRANLYLEGMEPWEEFDLVGQVVEIGNHVRLKVTERITRCAATNVDPASARRDMDVPGTLLRSFGHIDCGIFAEVLEGGLIAEGDSVRITL